MNNEIMQFFGLIGHFIIYHFRNRGNKRQVENIKLASRTGGIIALTGMVGSGKTTLLWKIQQQLFDEKQVLVCRSLSTDKNE